jgi:hypothetical protein
MATSVLQKKTDSLRLQKLTPFSAWARLNGRIPLALFSVGGLMPRRVQMRAQIGTLNPFDMD